MLNALATAAMKEVAEMRSRHQAAAVFDGYGEGASVLWSDCAGCAGFGRPSVMVGRYSPRSDFLSIKLLSYSPDRV